MVIVVYIIVQTMITTGNMSSLMQGLLVPMCTYSIVAIGLNLCVGYLGELSIGHAGFMCVGAFSSAFCTKLLQDSIQNEVVLFLIAIAVGTVAAAVFWIPHWYSGASSPRRLSCDRNACVLVRSSKNVINGFIYCKR